jgi:hypothetical protein
LYLVPFLQVTNCDNPMLQKSIQAENWFEIAQDGDLRTLERVSCPGFLKHSRPPSICNAFSSRLGILRLPLYFAFDSIGYDLGVAKPANGTASHMCHCPIGATSPMSSGRSDLIFGSMRWEKRRHSWTAITRLDTIYGPCD